MRTAPGNGLAAGVVLVLLIVIEAFALQAKTLGLVVIIAVAALAVLAVIAGADLVRIGLGAALASSFTLCWNGWFLGPVRPGDVLPAIALICFALAAPPSVFRSPPWWIKQLVAALLIGYVFLVLVPIDPFYLAHRSVLNAGGGLVHISYAGLPRRNFGIAVKFVIAVAALPVSFTAATLIDRRMLRWLAIAFGTGSATSGLVAFIDHTGVVSIGHYLTHIPNVSNRQLGFAFQPNFLAAGLVLAIPFGCWMAIYGRHRFERWIGVATVLACLLGIYASGSRGGAVCSVGTLLVALAVLPRTRPHLPVILLGAGVGIVGIAAVVPSIGLSILRVTRLYGNATAAGSDTVRSLVYAQGVRDFHHAPIFGIGLQSSTDASQVYLQELASGGLVLFLAMQTYMLGAAWDAFKRIAVDPLYAAILASLVGTLALNFVEADLTDRFYYVPQAILVATMISQRVAPDPELAAQSAVRLRRLRLRERASA